MDTKKGLRRISGYVYQDDEIKETLSVRETLLFYARLQLPSSVTKEERKKRVEKLIDDLGLRKVADTKIGNEARRGISGGEKKRVAIGVQLIRFLKKKKFFSKNSNFSCQFQRDPSILFLDEPTSGNSFNYLWYSKRNCNLFRNKDLTHSPRWVLCKSWTIWREKGLKNSRWKKM